MSSGMGEEQAIDRIATRTVSRNNRLDIHRIGETHLGIFREPFDEVTHLEGFKLKPANSALTIWTFDDAKSGRRGRLLDVAAYLQEDHVMLSGLGMTYMVRDHGRMLALLLPPAPRKIKLTEANFKVVPRKDEAAKYPSEWPRGLLVRVIRNWLHNVIIVDEKYLLARLTLN